MDGRKKQKTHDKLFARYIKIPLFALLAAAAVITGIQAGNILYKLDFHIIDKIDSQNFKNTISLSFPIIETVYNSGKASASFTGEVKNLFRKIFEFDLDSPVTILNVQSPLFMSYYNHEYKSMLALDDSNTPSPEQLTPDTGNEQSEPGVGTEGGREEGNNNVGEKPESDDGSTGSEDNTDVPDTQNNGQAAEPEKNSDGSGEGTGVTTPSAIEEKIDLQPISSIAYEVEDEAEDDDSDLVALDKMVIKNFTKHKIDIAKLLKEPLDLDLSGKGPKVLIYHTHTSESYVLKEEDLGKKNVPSFNSNPKYSVVRVGEELARNLRKYGIETLHNGTVHDKVRDAAYGVAINTLKSYVKSYPSIEVYIDIHRDAVEASKPKLRVVKKINGKNAAQIMFVMGTNDLLPHPDWEENLKFALKVQNKLNEKYPGLARPVWFVSKRYNQHISDHAVLIEVGGDGNLLSECLESTKYLAEALNEVMNEK